MKVAFSDISCKRCFQIDGKKKIGGRCLLTVKGGKFWQF